MHIDGLTFIGQIPTTGGANNSESTDLTIRCFIAVVVENCGSETWDWFADTAWANVITSSRDKDVQHFGRADAIYQAQP